MSFTWECEHHQTHVGKPSDGCACLRARTGNTDPPREPQSTAWVRWVKLLRKPEDVGIGDTIERMIASVGLDRWKSFSKKLGMPCNCDRRRDWLNQNYPY